MPKKTKTKAKAKKATRKKIKKDIIYDTFQDERLNEFQKNHTVKIGYGMSEFKAVVLGFTKDGIIVRKYGQQDHKEYKVDEIQFLGDLGIE